MSEPARRAYSREEMISEARLYMSNNYGMPATLDANEREHWYVKLGMMVDFISDMFPSNTGEQRP